MAIAAAIPPSMAKKTKTGSKFSTLSCPAPKPAPKGRRLGALWAHSRNGRRRGLRGGAGGLRGPGGRGVRLRRRCRRRQPPRPRTTRAGLRDHQRAGAARRRWPHPLPDRLEHEDLHRTGRCHPRRAGPARAGRPRHALLPRLRAGAPCRPRGRDGEDAAEPHVRLGGGRAAGRARGRAERQRAVRDPRRDGEDRGAPDRARHPRAMPPGPPSSRCPSGDP